MRRLHGWARLWIVLSIVALAVVYGVRTTIFSAPTLVANFYYQELERSTNCDDYWKRAGTEHQYPKPVNCGARSADEASRSLENAQQSLGRAFSDLQTDRRDWGVATIGIWLSMNLFAALMVLIGQWVKRGFRHAKN